MYFNDIHILIYLLVGVFGCIVGQVVGMASDRLINGEKIIEKRFFKKV